MRYRVCRTVPEVLSTRLCTCRYWNYLAKGRGRNGWRIDFFLVSSPLLTNNLEAMVDCCRPWAEYTILSFA